MSFYGMPEGRRVTMRDLAEAADPATPEHRTTADRAVAALKRAHALNDRVGVKTQIKRLEKAPAVPVPADPAPADSAPADPVPPAPADATEHPAAPAD